MFEAIGQQFELTGIDDKSTVSLKINERSTQPSWMRFATTDETKFEFTKAMVMAIRTLERSTHRPTLILDNQRRVKRYKLQAKTFTLPNGIAWKNPNPIAGGIGMTDSYLWEFPSKLQQYLFAYPDIPFCLMMQSRKTAFSLAEPEPVAPYFWSTAVQVKISQIPSSNNPSEPIDMVYAVEGCGAADAQLLQNLIMTPRARIKNLDILFDENESKDNNGDKVSGVISNPLSAFKTFLLQTNYSTASNPDTFFAINNKVASADNLIGMDAKTFVTYLWNCSIVRSGGYYLSYNNGTGGGLPSHLFDEEGAATITLLLSYDITILPGTTAYTLPNYVNSVMINKKIVLKEDNLYLEVYLTEAQREIFNPDLQTIQATIFPGTGLFNGKRTNPELLSINNLTDKRGCAVG